MALNRWLIPLLVAALAAGALAQDTVKRSEVLEDEGLRAESRGDFEAALDKFEKALTEAVREAEEAAEPRARADDLARAEFYLEKVGLLTEKTSRFAETSEFLVGVGSGAAGPSLKAWIDWYRARALVAQGRIDEARDLVGDLAFLTDWWLAGSFDNERGGGMGRAFPPEKGIDLEAKMKGKEREVSWRRVTSTPIFGYLDLDALFRPNDQCLAYALCHFRSPEDREAALRVGSDEGVMAWLNGRLVLDREIRRTCGLDQDIVGVRLRKGWNRLLVKVGDQTGPWGFRLRFTTPDGRPMTDLEVGNTKEEAAAAAKELAEFTPDPAEVEVVRDARDALEAQIDEDRADARTYFHLGYLHHRRRYEDESKREAQHILERAVELDPENPFLRFALAVASERTDQDKVDREENARRQQLEKTVELDRGYAVAYYLLAHYYTMSLPLYARAEANLAKALEVNPKFLDARLLEIDLLRRRGLTTEADEKLAALLDEDGFETYLPFLVRSADREDSLHDADGAEQTLRTALTIDFAAGAARTRLSGVLEGKGRVAEAIALQDERIRLDPFDTGAMVRKATLLEGLGRYEEAADTALRALRVCPEDDAVLNQIGRLRMKMGDKEKALACFKEALELNPKAARLRRYVEFVDPESRPFEDAFPADLEPLLARAREFTSEENDPWLNVLDQQIDKVNPDGTSSSFHRTVVKILNDQGVQRFDRFGARFTPGEQQIHWKLARVLKPDGSTVDGRIVGGRFADLPPLVPGDIVQLEWRVDELRQSFFGDFFGQAFYFGDWVPGLLSEYVVITPEEKELYFHTVNIDLEPEVSVGPEGKTKVFTFKVEDPPKIRMEPNMPSPREVFPQVQVSNYRSWDEFAKWYWHLIKDQFQLDDEMRAKVRELTEGKQSRYEKVRAIYDFVTSDIRYDSSWEFGVHGYKPYDATAIYARKFGDCKDKSILITTLLRAIGVESFPVLICATAQRWKEDLELPLVHHFNHCISYVPDVDGEGHAMFLDGTAQYHSIAAMPGMDRGARVLVVRPDGAQIVQIPWPGPGVNGMDQELVADVAADGSAKVKATLTFGGDLAVMIRQLFSIEGQRALRLNMLVGNFFGQAKVEDFSFTDLADLSVTTAGMTAEIEVPKFAVESDRGLELRVMFGQFQLGQLTSRTERQWDLVLTTPNHMSVHSTYRLPEGFRVVSLPEDVSVEEPFGSLSAKYETADGEVRVALDLTLTSHRVAKEAYGSFRDFISAADVAFKDRIVIAKD